MVILIQDRQRCGVGRTRPCFTFNDAALGLVARRRRVSNINGWTGKRSHTHLYSSVESYYPQSLPLSSLALSAFVKWLWSPTLFPTWAYILTVLRREVEAKKIDVRVVRIFVAKSSEAEETLVHHTEDK